MEALAETTTAVKNIPALRFSGFEGEWVKNKLRDVCKKTISYGIVQTGESLEGGIPCVRVIDLTSTFLDVNQMIRTSQKINDSYSKTILEKGDLMLALRGEIGLVKIVQDELIGANLTRGVARIAINDLKFSPEFILWLLHSPSSLKEINNRVNGSALKEIPLNGLREVILFLPKSKFEQQKIASFLTAVDDKIQQLSKKKELLEQYKKGVIQQIFSQQIQFKDDNGIDFPEWEEKRLGEICDTFKSGESITSKDISNAGEFPVYGGNGLRGYTNKYTHNGFYTLIGRQGALCGNINRAYGKSYISEHAIAVAANESSDTEWLAQKLELMNLNRLSESSAQPGLAVNKLQRLKLKVPSLPEQQKIASFLTAIDAKLQQLDKKKESFGQFKKGLLQQLFV